MKRPLGIFFLSALLAGSAHAADSYDELSLGADADISGNIEAEGDAPTGSTLPERTEYGGYNHNPGGIDGNMRRPSGASTGLGVRSTGSQAGTGDSTPGSFSEHPDGVSEY